MYGKSPGHRETKRFYFDIPNQGRVCLRSSWELVVATYLVSKQVDFRYEYKRFTLDAKTFLPDFYLVKEDKFIEVKGFADSRFKQKMIEMPIFYPEVKVEVFTGKEIRAIRNKSIRPNEISNSEV